MKNQKKSYFYSDHRLQLHQVKWYKLRITGIGIILTMVALSILLIVNHYHYDFLGLGYTKVSRLELENQILREQVQTLTTRMRGMKTVLDKLNEQGNQLRLLVDLETLNEDIQSAGTGGAVLESPLELSGDITSRVLQSASTLLEKLSSEMKIQEQSYGQIIRKYDANKKYFGAFPALKPMDGYYSSKGFGVRMHPVLGIFKTHEGLDIINDVGTPVVAAGDGIVEMAGHSGGGYGIVVVINHGFGYQTFYAHLSKTLVKEGAQIKRGEVIAKSGKTGLVTGPHLHYEVRYQGICKNPMDYFLDDVRPLEYRQLVASK